MVEENSVMCEINVSFHSSIGGCHAHYFACSCEILGLGETLKVNELCSYQP